MSRHSSITQTWTGAGSGNCKPAVGIRKLVCVQMQIVQRLDVIAASSTQKPSPERAQMIPSRTQMLMMVIRDESQVPQAELRNDLSNLPGHCKQGRSKAGVLPGGAPGDDERISRQLNCPLTREQTHRTCWSALPRGVALRSLPPFLVSEMDISEQKGTSTRPPTCRCIQSYPKVAMYPHHRSSRCAGAGGGAAATPGGTSGPFAISLVPCVHQDANVFGDAHCP